MLCKFKLHCYLFCSASFAPVLRSVSVWHSLIRRLQPFTHWYATELLYLVVLYSRVFVFNLYFTFFHLIYKNSLGIVLYIFAQSGSSHVTKALSSPLSARCHKSPALHPLVTPPTGCRKVVSPIFSGPAGSKPIRFEDPVTSGH